MVETSKTTPTKEQGPSDLPVVSPHIVTADGAEYVHRDLVKAVDPWSVEDHVGPPSGTFHFGDTASFAQYVKDHGIDGHRFVGWNRAGMRATLDAHSGQETGRQSWLAVRAFVRSSEWDSWLSLTAGVLNQQQVVEFFEDHSDDITAPTAGDLTAMLRVLRVNANAQAQTEIKSDGSVSVDFQRSTRVNEGKAELPPTFSIAIPVLNGHVDDQGKTVRYQLTVRMRPTVTAENHLVFRFSIPASDKVLEEVLQEQVVDLRTRLTDLHVYRLAD